jgi:hypothetical protein
MTVYSLSLDSNALDRKMNELHVTSIKAAVVNLATHSENTPAGRNEQQMELDDLRVQAPYRPQLSAEEIAAASSM